MLGLDSMAFPVSYKKLAMEVEDFLSAEEEGRIIEAIKRAESRTSGEIRVHLERNLKVDPILRAEEIFCLLGMDRTTYKNGVLFYVAVDDHRFAVIGDEGIDKVVPDDFWDSIKNEVVQEFARGDHAKGLIAGILHAGEKLKEYFPYDHENGNELSDEISKHH